MKDQILEEGRRLHDLGLAVHWLRSKSKMPIESGWTTGPRKSWKYLSENYSPGMNVGVRLGIASKIGGCYLAVIDCDVKSGIPRHETEMLRVLKKGFPGFESCPTVRSGRGNGSMHIYCLTAEPQRPRLYARSENIVKVSMPSARPSKKELEKLSQDEIKKGTRLRPAWEISIMGEGQQVVLPPSIHPDSGQAYSWLIDFRGKDELPLMSFPTMEGSPPKDSKIERSAGLGSLKSKFNFEVKEIDLSLVKNLDPKTYRSISAGEGVEDRSSAIFWVCHQLVGAGLERDEILSVLTDPELFLGTVAYEHAGNTRNRQRAARWVWEHTLKKVMADRDGEKMFRDAPNSEGGDDDFFPVAELAPAEDFGLPGGNEGNGFYTMGPKGALTPDYTALMNKFSELHPFVTSAEMDEVFVFKKTHYERITEAELRGFAEEYFNPKPSGEKIRSEFVNKINSNNIKKREFFTKGREGKINFKNGILDINDSVFGPELGAHSPKYGFRTVLPYDFDPAARCPFFEKWIYNVMSEDEELVFILQEYMGYVVRGGEYKYHKALWLGGDGQNGKSTFVNLLKRLVGEGNYSSIPIKALVSGKFMGAELDGKLTNISEETSPEDLKDSSVFKNLTGDGDIVAEKKFGNPFYFRNQAKLIMTYNEIPEFKDVTGGFMRRPLIVVFDRIFTEDEADRDILNKLSRELPGIFNFALKGWERLENQNGFTKSEKSKLILEESANKSCNVYEWVEDFIDFLDWKENMDRQVFTAADLYLIYMRNVRQPFTSMKFKKRLIRHPKMKLHFKKTATKNVYHSIQVRG